MFYAQLFCLFIQRFFADKVIVITTKRLLGFINSDYYDDSNHYDNNKYKSNICNNSNNNKKLY